LRRILVQRQGLEAIAHHLGIKVHQRHSAAGEALATAKVFQRGLATRKRIGPGRFKDLVRAGSF